MCLEDLRLGKGRTRGVTKVTSVTANAIFPPNLRRVALMVSFGAATYYDAGGVTQVVDLCSITFGPISLSTPDIVMGAFTTPFVLRIEDIGQIITNAISVSVTQASGLAALALVEIISDVDAPAIYSGRP